MGVVVEEIDETLLWFELLVESKTIAAERLDGLMGEARELLAICAASQKTARSRGRTIDNR
jgi:hypothetical protein